MPELHSEPYIYVAGLSHRSVLLAWGAFYFKAKSAGEMKLVDDDDLQWVHPPRAQTIGARSEPYGPATVVVQDESGAVVASETTHLANHCIVAGLQPNTRYHYTLKVKNGVWAEGERWEWVPTVKGLKQLGRQYRNEFVTLPDPTQPLTSPFSFIVMGDFGTGVRKVSKSDARQREIAEVLARVVDAHDVRLMLTTGDNIYAKRKFLLFTSNSGDEDDDWFFTYFQPYRYVLNRIPVYPSIGNHDTGESEDSDDRQQVIDNFYLDARLAGEEVAGRASLDPGLFYKFRVASDVEFVCLDTSKEALFSERLFKHPKHQAFIRSAFPPAGSDGVRWRIPFSHHPAFCAGPQHHNTKGMEDIVTMLERGGVRACFSGHEHNFQHAQHNGVTYFVTGAGSKVRTSVPNKFADAHTRSWAATCHFLLVTIDGTRMTVRAIGEDAAGGIRDVVRQVLPAGTSSDPMVVEA